MAKKVLVADALTEVLRRTIRESRVPYLTLAKATGVQRASIQRFIDGRTSIRLDKAGRLAEYFGLELRPVERRRKGK